MFPGFLTGRRAFADPRIARYELGAIDQDNHTIRLGAGGWQLADSSEFGNTPFYVENILEELDSPLEVRQKRHLSPDSLPPAYGQFCSQRQSLFFHRNQVLVQSICFCGRSVLLSHFNGVVPLCKPSAHVSHRPHPTSFCLYLQWYLDETTGRLYVFPNQSMPSPPPPPPPQVIVLNKGVADCTLAGAVSGCCVDLQFYSASPGAKFAADNCHPDQKPENQEFTYNTSNGHLVVGIAGHCLSGDGSSVTAELCAEGDKAQSWTLSSGTISNQNGCLAATTKPGTGVTDGAPLYMSTCNSSDPTQNWQLANCTAAPCFPGGETWPDDSALGTNTTTLDSEGPFSVQPPRLVEMAIHDSVVRIVGADDDPVMNVEISGVRISHTATTQMNPYEVPSGGDWAIHRGGAIFVEGAEEVAIKNCWFDSVGGNAVFFSRHVVNSTVSGNKFSFPGDSGIALVGTSDLANGLTSSQPRGNIIANNWVRRARSSRRASSSRHLGWPTHVQIVCLSSTTLAHLGNKCHVFFKPLPARIRSWITSGERPRRLISFPRLLCQRPKQSERTMSPCLVASTPRRCFCRPD